MRLLPFLPCLEIRGTVRRSDAGLRLERPLWKLLNLADQVDREIDITGHLWSLNGQWWLEYRGTRLYLVTSAGPVMTFKSNDHGRSVRVTGTLLNQDRPSLEQISLKTDRDLVGCFVVRGARVSYLEADLAWSQRFGPLYPGFFRLEDDVPLLLAETSFRRNNFGNETNACLFNERNYEAIGKTLREMSPKVLQILARRMNDPATEKTLRLLYAAMLARANDERGRSYLLKLTNPPYLGLPLSAHASSA